MFDEWTEQDEQQLRELRRRKKAWQITQKGRKRQFGAKKYKLSINANQESRKV